MWALVVFLCPVTTEGIDRCCRATVDFNKTQHRVLLKYSSHFIPLSLYLLKCAAQRATAGLTYILSSFWEHSFGPEINRRKMEMWGWGWGKIIHNQRQWIPTHLSAIFSSSLFLSGVSSLLKVLSFQTVVEFHFHVSHVDILSVYLPGFTAACFISSVPTDHQEEGELLYKYCPSFLFSFFCLLVRTRRLGWCWITAETAALAVGLFLILF